MRTYYKAQELINLYNNGYAMNSEACVCVCACGGDQIPQ